MQDDSYFFFLFLCFLGRQHAGLKGDRYFELRCALEDGTRPFDEAFFVAFPEYQPWQEKPATWWKKGADELRREYERGRHFILRGTPEFPASLELIPEPPWVLTVLGDPSALLRPSLSIVGAREPSRSSLQWLDEHLAQALRKLPEVNVVSGGARGVDQAAHRVALRQERPTLVFLPSGLGELYPKDLKEWILPVCETGGAFVSEFHPRTVMRKWNFHVRNRLIAGLSRNCLVVEARVKSGTHLTATLAAEAGRELGCLPASPWENSFSGNLELLTHGAQLIKNAQDLVMFCSGSHLVSSRKNLPIGEHSIELH